jgi:2-methylcitrate dehydratase PrpD
MTLSRVLVERWKQAASRPLPAPVVQAAKLHLLDAIGVGLAASATTVGAPYRLFVEQSTTGPASLFTGADGAGPAEAALVNGGLIHSLEYDDTHIASIAHGSSVVAAAALAVGEAGNAGGEALLKAYVLGWETLIRIGLAAPGLFQDSGFQVTSVGGTMVAAAIASELAVADARTMIMSIGIALSQSSGVFEFLSNGSSVKSLHPGWAAHAGVIAARLARVGLTGPETAFEGRFGLFRNFARDENAIARFARALEDLGELWHLSEAAFKLYPCCHYLHPFIEAAGRLVAQGVTAERIARLECRVPRGAAPIICEPWERKRDASGHEARWSLPVVVAARLIDGEIDLDTFEREISPLARGLARRMTWSELEGARFPERFEAELSCALRSGETQLVRIDDVHGSSNRPADPDIIRQKFRGNAGRVLGDLDMHRLEAAVDRLDISPDVTALSAALRGPRKPTGGAR